MVASATRPEVETSVLIDLDRWIGKIRCRKLAQ
jgi:hypothetical protein